MGGEGFEPSTQRVRNLFLQKATAQLGSFRISAFAVALASVRSPQLFYSMQEMVRLADFSLSGRNLPADIDVFSARAGASPVLLQEVQAENSQKEPEQYQYLPLPGIHVT